VGINDINTLKLNLESPPGEVQVTVAGLILDAEAIARSPVVRSIVKPVDVKVGVSSALYIAFIYHPPVGLV
jgi:hypothetical protein